jgi:hypothetical protein
MVAQMLNPYHWDILSQKSPKHFNFLKNCDIFRILGLEYLETDFSVIDE